MLGLELVWAIILVVIFLYFGSIRKTGNGGYEFVGMPSSVRSGRIAFLQKIGFLARYDELSLFFIDLICLMFFIFDPFFKLLLAANFSFWLSLLLIFIAVSLPIVYYAFSSKTIPGRFIAWVLLPATALNFIIASQAWENVQAGSRFLLVFPFFNLVGAFFALMAVGRRGGDEQIQRAMLEEKNAMLPEIIFGSMAVGVLFFLSNFVFQNHWTITFSICLTYSLMVNGLIVKYLFKGKKSPV